MAVMLTVREFAQLSALTEFQVLNRIRRKKIPGARKRGWHWEIPKSALSKIRAKKQ